MEHLERYAVLLDCQTESQWLGEVLRLGEEHGYERTLLALVPNRHDLSEGVFIRGNYPEQWRRIYDRSGMAAIDPVVSHCFGHSLPLIWEPGLFAGEAQGAMYEEACSYGIRAGVTFPFHGAHGELGILCFVNDTAPDREFRKHALHNTPSLSLLRDFAFETARVFADAASRPAEAPRVTPRELECLKWGAAGLSSWEISLLLHCSERTVNFHLGNIRRKLNAVTTRQAIARAIHLGLI